MKKKNSSYYIAETIYAVLQNSRHFDGRPKKASFHEKDKGSFSHFRQPLKYNFRPVNTIS